MSNYFGPETMFILSLKPSQREFLTDTIEEAVQMRSEGLEDGEIEGRLSHAITTIEGWSHTPRIVRRIVLGTFTDGKALSD